MWQTPAIFEIVHAATGLVKSNTGTVFFQVFSRIASVWLVVWFLPAQILITPGFWLMTFAWVVTEVMRYVVLPAPYRALGGKRHCVLGRRYAGTA